MARGALDTHNLQEGCGETCVSAVILFDVYVCCVCLVYLVFLLCLSSIGLSPISSQVPVSDLGDVKSVTFSGDETYNASH